MIITDFNIGSFVIEETGEDKIFIFVREDVTVSYVENEYTYARVGWSNKCESKKLEDLF